MVDKVEMVKEIQKVHEAEKVDNVTDEDEGMVKTEKLLGISDSEVRRDLTDAEDL